MFQANVLAREKNPATPHITFESASQSVKALLGRSHWRKTYEWLWNPQANMKVYGDLAVDLATFAHDEFVTNIFATYDSSADQLLSFLQSPALHDGADNGADNGADDGADDGADNGADDEPDDEPVRPKQPKKLRKPKKPNKPNKPKELKTKKWKRALTLVLLYRADPRIAFDDALKSVEQIAGTGRAHDKLDYRWLWDKKASPAVFVNLRNEFSKYAQVEKNFVAHVFAQYKTSKEEIFSFLDNLLPDDDDDDDDDDNDDDNNDANNDDNDNGDEESGDEESGEDSGEVPPRGKKAPRVAVAECEKVPPRGKKAPRVAVAEGKAPRGKKPYCTRGGHIYGGDNNDDADDENVDNNSDADDNNSDADDNGNNNANNSPSNNINPLPNPVENFVHNAFISSELELHASELELRELRERQLRRIRLDEQQVAFIVAGVFDDPLANKSGELSENEALKKAEEVVSQLGEMDIGSFRLLVEKILATDGYRKTLSRQLQTYLLFYSELPLHVIWQTKYWAEVPDVESIHTVSHFLHNPDFTARFLPLFWTSELCAGLKSQAKKDEASMEESLKGQAFEASEAQMSLKRPAREDEASEAHDSHETQMSLKRPAKEKEDEAVTPLTAAPTRIEDDFGENGLPVRHDGAAFPITA